MDRRAVNYKNIILYMTTIIIPTLTANLLDILSSIYDDSDKVNRINEILEFIKLKFDSSFVIDFADDIRRIIFIPDKTPILFDIIEFITIIKNIMKNSYEHVKKHQISSKNKKLLSRTIWILLFT